MRQRLMYQDQNGVCFWATSVKELRERVGGGRVSKMYVDKKDGSTVHIGYVIGKRWLTMFAPVERRA